VKGFSQLLGKILKPNLWLHICLIVIGAVLLFCPGLFPSEMCVFQWIAALDVILVWGIGDGYPTTKDKMIGGCILIGLALVTLFWLALIVSLMVRLARREK